VNEGSVSAEPETSKGAVAALLPDYAALQTYPFEKLRRLTEAVQPNPELEHIPLSLGEPKHAPPRIVIEALTDGEVLAQQLATYPVTKGSVALREAIAGWLLQRFSASIDPEQQILPVNGTREALFAFAQAVVRGSRDAKVIMPNPFYQIYEGAALLASATPYFVANDPTAGYQQDFASVPTHILDATQLVYICSPGNPTGQIMSEADLRELITLAHKHNFIIAADECYSELYFEDQHRPISLLEASNNMGNPDYARCVVFHSLSKRSNLPGLRSGFVAGDAQVLAHFLKYRTYHGCALSPHHQAASTIAWNDEAHVIENRQLYRNKFDKVEAILRPHYPVTRPAGGFYHWLRTPIDDQAFCQQLLAAQNITVMPGTYLGRAVAADGTASEREDTNPGYRHVRIAWVAAIEDCVAAAERLAKFASEIVDL